VLDCSDLPGQYSGAATAYRADVYRDLALCCSRGSKLPIDRDGGIKYAYTFLVKIDWLRVQVELDK
jgi:hypothetical protein